MPRGFVVAIRSRRYLVFSALKPKIPAWISLNTPQFWPFFHSSGGAAAEAVLVAATAMTPTASASAAAIRRWRLGFIERRGGGSDFSGGLSRCSATLRSVVACQPHLV